MFSIDAKNLEGVSLSNFVCWVSNGNRRTSISLMAIINPSSNSQFKGTEQTHSSLTLLNIFPVLVTWVTLNYIILTALYIPVTKHVISLFKHNVDYGHTYFMGKQEKIFSFLIISFNLDLFCSILGRGGGNEKWLLNQSGISFWWDKDILALDSGNHYTTLWIY